MLMKDEVLKDVDIVICFLDDIAKCPDKKKCLQTFCKYQDLIKWLRNTAPKGFM